MTKRHKQRARKKASPQFTATPHRLSAEAVKALAEFLRVESAPPHVVRRIEYALGLGVHGPEHLDHAPRPTDYADEFEAARRHAYELSERLAEWGGYLYEAARLHGCDIHDVQEALASLVGAGTAVMRDHQGKSSRGAPTKIALMTCIAELRRIFRDHYCGPSEERERKGAFEFATEQERHEHGFVETALLDAQVDIHTDLQRLMRDSRTQPSVSSPVQRLP